jgi:peptidoglycan-associated lipoprotein
MSSHRPWPQPSPRPRINRQVWPALLAIGIGGACSHTQRTEAAATPATVVTLPGPARPTPPRPPAPEPAATPSDDSKGNKELAVYFDFDSALLRDDARPVLQQVAGIARARDTSVRIEGNCDELGTIEYNLALGEHRAIQAKDYLTKLGVPPAHIKTVSYGSQRPKASGHDEQARAENRRDDLVVVPNRRR